MKNTTTTQTIKTFSDLNAWREAHKLAVDLYKVTRKFPSDEKFGLVNQMRRSAVSVSSNIAEGFARNSRKDKLHFYNMAVASLAELQSQIAIAKDVDFIDKDTFDSVSIHSVNVRKLILGLMKSAESKQP